MDLDELAKQYGGVSATPESVNLDELAKKLGGTSRPVKERTVTEAFTDPAAKFASGIGQLIQFPGQIYGLTTGAIKEKDFATTGLQGLGQNLQDYAKKKLSEKLLSEEAETARKVEEAEKKGQLAAFGTQVSEVLKNPLTQGIGFAAEQLPQAIPSILAAAIPGVGPAAAAELRAAQAAAKAAVGSAAKKEAADAALKLAQDAALKSQISRGTKAAIGTGATQQGADIGSGSFEEIKQYLMTEKGLTEPEAAAQALNLARAAGASGAAISLLAQKLPGAQALERALAGERLGTGRIKGAIAGAIKNIPEEMVEEGGGKFTQNLALRDVNPEQSLTAGLGQTLGQAALGAGVIGGGAGALSGGKPTINPEDVQKAEFEKRRAEDVKRAEEKRTEIAGQMEVVKNPIGALTEADLGPELSAYVNKHRTDTGKPTLSAYSLDDVVDALPGKDRAALSAGTNDALNTLIAQKTGYTDQVYTPDQVTALATEKNVDITTPGFGDFLSRTTGINDVALMSQPQLHSAITALQKLPTFETKQELPEGTNATRYTPEQLTQAIDGLNAKMDALGKDELSLKETTKAVETATGLKGSAVNALLNDATKSGNIVTENNKVSVPSRSTPAGYDIQEEVGVEEEQAESYDVMSGDQKVRSMDTMEQAEAHAEKLNSFAQAELKKTQDDLKAQDQKIAKSENELHKFELNGLVGTPAYKAAEEAHQAVLDEAMPVIADLKNQEEIYSRPVTVVPVGTKKVTPKTYRVTKGEAVKGTKATREEAEQSIFEDLSDKEIQELAKTKSPKLQARVNAEIARRATAPAPEPKTAEQAQKLQAVQASLQSMLGRFGLQDVALKIVDAIEQGADGSYAAKVIQLAIDAQNPVRVLRHESLHALKELGFFTDSQWKALERQAKAEWVDKYLKSNQTKMPDGRVVSRYDAYVEMGLNEEAILEEAIADAFGDFDATKAPPGMLNALLNKLRNFFSTLKSYLNGQGYESYKDIFGKIEKGELKPSKPAEPSKEVKKSLIRPAVEGETEISTRNPQGVKRTNDPVAEMLSIDEAAVREAMKANPDMYKRTVQAIQGYGFVPLNTPPKDVIGVFKRNIINNLMYLYNAVPEDIRERSKLWYDGANRIATDMSKNYKVSMEQVSGIMAAMSPQKDWFQNVSMAERALDILTEQGNKAWDENMLKYAESYVKEASNRKEREKRQLAFDRIKKVAAEGTTLNNMTQDNAAAFIRAYDEAYNSRQYRIVTPEGGFGGLVLNNDGKPATMMWSTYDPIKKTVSIFRDGSRKNISEQLGEEHKIRSFYNNIAAPNSDIGHVTIDTHAVAAGLFEALAGTDEEVIHNFGGTGKNINLGVGGTYGIIADAYREAAEKVGLRAREMQSITWEAVRGLFGENIKSTIKPKIRTEWSKYKNGEQSFDETREKVMKIAGGIDNPDWVGSGAGDFVSNGGASYDKAFTPEGGVRLRESKDIRENLTFNLSAVTNSIPGLRELYARAMGRDKEAYTLLQKVAESSLKFLLSKTNAKVNVEYAKGVYLSDREPSISVSVSFAEKQMPEVMAGLAKFADSYNQQQIHVRQETAQKFGHDFGDGSYATAVYEIDLKKQLNNDAISRVIDESGLQGFTITDQKLTTYFVRTEGNEQDNFKSFAERVKRVHGLVGVGSSRIKQTVERLYVYGDGYGARIPYSEVTIPTSDIRTEQKSDTVTPKLIAEYLTKAPVTTFKQKPLNAKQVKEQKRLAKAWEEMPINDLQNPLVKRAYTALANSLKEQFKVIPIKVELMETIDEPYANSDAVRRDVSLNNRFKVYATTPETFGPPGSNFKNHPLLKDSGLKDVNGKPMLYNDLLRAVHDYFAHNLTETQFGPNGEAAAWRNHMAITPDPFARWALTAETRGQNAWQNFRPGVEGLNLLERGFADQKAALPPIEFVMTGDSKVDQPVTELKEVLTPEQQRGSVPVTAKYSLKSFFRSPEAAERAAYKKAPPTTDAFKRWFGDSVLTEEGRPVVMYHGSPNEFSIFSENRPIFVSSVPDDAEFFAALKRLGRKQGKPYIYPLWVRAEKPFDFENPDHIEQVMDYMVENHTSPENANRVQVIGHGFKTPEQLSFRLENGDWTYIESANVQDALKALGFDSFQVLEGGKKNLAVFDANQVKSATGNTGEFGETKDMRFSLRNVDTPEFKRFFAGSKFVNADGTPKVLYHGTKSDIDTFKVGNGAFGRGIYVTEYPDRTDQYWGKYGKFGEPMGPDGGNVMPVYVRMTNPKPITTDIFKVKRPDGSSMTRDEAAQYITDQAIAEGYDGLVNMSGDKVWEAVVFNPYQIKSAIGNTGAYSRAEPSIKLSFPSIADQIAQTTNGTNANQRILETTTAREEQGFIERMMKAISPESWSSFRAQAINRYNQMSVNDKKIAQAMGGIELLADSSAEAAALQSDTSAGIAAAVMGYGDSKGGVPVYEKGYTTVSDLNGTVKGLTELLMPLAQRGDPYIFRAFQFYSGVKRGTRLDADGKEKLFEKKDIQYAKDLELLYPEFASVHADWIKYNNGHVDYMVKTGVLTPEKGKIFKKYSDYIPFYRQLEGEETFGPNIFQSLANVKPPKKIKGGEAPLADFLETVVRNTQASIQSGMKNIAATRAIDQALFLGTASQLPQVSSAPYTVTILRNGIPVSYAVSDRLLFDAMQSLHLPEMPFLGILSGPANLLRNLVTKDPGFMLANMMRDSLSAYATSGANMTPIVDTIRNFGSVMANRSPEFVKLVNAGVIGGYEFSRDVVSSGGELAKDLRKKSKTQTEGEKALRPITSLWGFLEKGTEASDAATRIAVYKDVMARTGNEAEAIRQAAEVMNFNRKGSSPIIRIVTASIPFLNARIQGLDVLYRAGMAPRPDGVNKTDHQRRVQKNFLIRGTTMMALSSMYWFMMQDDEEYKKQEQEVRDNNWIIPMINARIPIPFEVGVLFKVIPERILAFAFGNDTGEDLANSMERALRSTFGVNYIPQTVLPLVEATTNYSYFTMRPIVSQGVEGIRPGLQVGPNTTQIAETVGKALNVSPIKIDHIVQGYTGTMGMYLVNTLDAIFDAMSDKQKPSLRIEQYPILKRFMIDSEAKGSVSAYFELKKAVDETVRTVNALEAGGQGEELADFIEGKHRMFGLDTASLLGARGFITNMDAKMKPLLENARKIRASEMDPDEKREALSTINEALISMTSNIQEIKKGLSQ
jgi:hypothetical protein